MEDLEVLEDDIIVTEENARGYLTLNCLNRMQHFRGFYEKLMGRKMTYLDMYAIQMFIEVFEETFYEEEDGEI